MDMISNLNLVPTSSKPIKWLQFRKTTVLKFLEPILVIILILAPDRMFSNFMILIFVLLELNKLTEHVQLIWCTFMFIQALRAKYNMQFIYVSL